MPSRAASATSRRVNLKYSLVRYPTRRDSPTRACSTKPPKWEA